MDHQNDGNFVLFKEKESPSVIYEIICTCIYWRNETKCWNSMGRTFRNV